MAQTLGKFSVTISFCRSDFAAQHNALARGQRQILGGAHRLAVPTFHTPVDFFLNGFCNFQVGGVIGVFLGKNHTRVQETLRVDQALNLEHDLKELVTELTAHKRCHNTPGSVLCLERAVSIQNELHHFLGEVAVPHKLLGIAELFVEHEVNIAVFGVPENDRVLVAVGVKERGQIATGGTEHVHRDHHILKQRIRAGWAVACDRGVQPAPCSPERITLRKFAGHFDR